jgi:hypothetical protein
MSETAHEFYCLSRTENCTKTKTLASLMEAGPSHCASPVRGNACGWCDWALPSLFGILTRDCCWIR